MAVSFDENYLSNLIQSGMLPLQITLKVWAQLKGDEILNIDIKDRDSDELKPGEMITIETMKKDKSAGGETVKLEANLKLDNPYEV
jgi:aconitase A